MWLDKLNALRKQSGMTNKFIAEKMHRSERTIARFFSGETRIGIDEASELAAIMGSSLDEIFDESDFKLPTPEIEALKLKVEALSKTIEEMIARENELTAERAFLKENNIALQAENERLRIIIAHKDEIIYLHNYYNKIKSDN